MLQVEISLPQPHQRCENRFKRNFKEKQKIQSISTEIFKQILERKFYKAKENYNKIQTLLEQNAKTGILNKYSIISEKQL